MSIDFTELAGSYEIDTAHTRIGFVAPHAMVTKVRGAFNEFSGKAHIDGQNPNHSTVEITIEAATRSQRERTPLESHTTNRKRNDDGHDQ